MEKMPWFKTAKRYRPNNMKDQSRQTIDRFLSLEHVYGFNGQSKRNNLIYTGEGLDYVFTSASLGIVVDPSQEIGKQRYMSGHTDDIISIATFQIKKNVPVLVSLLPEKLVDIRKLLFGNQIQWKCCKR